MATQNLILHNISALSDTAATTSKVRLRVSVQVHNTGNAMNCRLNRAGGARDSFWAGSKLGRGYHMKRGLPAHIDRHGLIQRQEEVAIMTQFGGSYTLISNGTDDNGAKGTTAYKIIEIPLNGQPFTLSSQLWTARDFNYTR